MVAVVYIDNKVLHNYLYLYYTFITHPNCAAKTPLPSTTRVEWRL